MENQKVWMLTFEGDCSDCNGVFSTREKAKAALMSHYERCKDIWSLFSQEVEEDTWETWSFKLPNNENLTGVLICECEIDMI